MWGRLPACRLGRHPAARITGQGCPVNWQTGCLPYISRQALRLWTFLAFFGCWAISQPDTAFAAPGSIRFAGQPAELTLSEVSEWTVRLELAPLDEQGRPRPATPSTVLVPFPVTQRMRVSQMDGNLRMGRLRVSVTSQPFVVTVRRDDGKLVQELVFDTDASTNAGVSFRTEAVVLGLGEGAQQFDRRARYGHFAGLRGGTRRGESQRI